MLVTRVKSKQQPWTIILLVYVGSIVDLIGLTNTNDKRSRDRYNVELRFKGYYISAGQTSLLEVQCLTYDEHFTLAIVIRRMRSTSFIFRKQKANKKQKPEIKRKHNLKQHIKVLTFKEKGGVTFPSFSTNTYARQTV